MESTDKKTVSKIMFDRTLQSARPNCRSVGSFCVAFGFATLFTALLSPIAKSCLILAIIFAIISLVTSLVGFFVVNSDGYGILEKQKAPENIEDREIWMMQILATEQIVASASARCLLGLWFAVVSGILMFALSLATAALFYT